MKMTKTMKTRNEYGPIIFREENVRVRVPKLSGWMVFVEENEFKDKRGMKIIVDDHWRSSSLLSRGKKIILQRNFFRLSEGDFGKSITADVEARKKITVSGWEILLVDIRKVDSYSSHKLRVVKGKDSKPIIFVDKGGDRKRG